MGKADDEFMGAYTDLLLSTIKVLERRHPATFASVRTGHRKPRE